MTETTTHSSSVSSTEQHFDIEYGKGVSSPSSAIEERVDHQRKVFQSVKGLFSKIFQEATIVTVDPLRCLSLRAWRSRPLCRWGVRKIKETIIGQATSDSFIQGFVNTGKFAIIAKIPKDRESLIVDHLIDKGESEDAANELAVSGSWFQVVDGGHVHQSLVESIHDFSEKFAGFRWTVVLIPWQTDEALRAIGRMCNQMQKDAHLIDFPLPNAMQSLRKIIEQHSRSTGIPVVPGERVRSGFIKEVIGLYSGQVGYSGNTLRSVCGIVMKLPSSFVETMSSLLTEECDEYWKTLGAKRPFGADTRIFKKLISTQSLKTATTFLDQKVLTDEDRVNVIHRLRFLARERESFKAFQSSEIDTQARSVLAARKEVEKFDNFLGEEVWPNDMENLKRNMLQTTLLDGDIKDHLGGNDQLLSSMVSSYLKSRGAHGSQKLGQYQRRIELQQCDLEGEDEIIESAGCRRNARREQGVLRENDDGNFREALGSRGDNAETYTGLDTPDASSRKQRESGATETEEENEGLILSKAGIEVLSMSLLEYERISVDIGGSFDFVIADPFQKIPSDPAHDAPRSNTDEVNLQDELVDDKGVSLYVQSLRRLLANGGFCFIFLEWSKLSQWKNCCESSQFEMVCEPFLVLKDSSRIQRMTTKGLQSICDPAIVIKKPGCHHDGFVIDKVSPYVHLTACRLLRWCNVIDGVPPPPQGLTFKPSRAHVRSNEKPCSLFIEIFTTFCPSNGRVLDPTAGALTTGLACLATNRTCVLLETDERCLFHAKSRLRDLAKSRLVQRLSLTSRQSDVDVAKAREEGNLDAEECNPRDEATRDADGCLMRNGVSAEDQRGMISSGNSEASPTTCPTSSSRETVSDIPADHINRDKPKDVEYSEKTAGKEKHGTCRQDTQSQRSISRSTISQGRQTNSTEAETGQIIVQYLQLVLRFLRRELE